MTSGNALLWVALAASVLSLLDYILVLTGKKVWRRAARVNFSINAIALTAASCLLMQAFLTRRFGLDYVFNYSSAELSRIFTISAFWAGQEGAFLLWAFFGGLLGVYFLLRAGEDENHGMIVLNAVQIFLVVMMLKKSPFAPLSPAMLQQMGLAPGAIPPNGAGLNPLLQDFWMAIHPPLIFLGYAALAIPFAMAFSALARRDYDKWVVRALPWTAFAWAMLGLGIFIGGYWAYKVLGWGGYWGWDPVENASLIPWLTCTALLHGMLTQRAVKGMRRTNLALAIFTFLLVLYGTYLTRSGVLGDFSVHSFADAGLSGLLIAFCLGFLALGLGFLAWRWRDVPNPDGNLYSATTSREFAFLMTVLVLSASAALVLVGTSSPVITTAMKNLHLRASASKVDTSYYLWTNTPVGILLALLLGLCPLMAWKGRSLAEFGKTVRIPALLAVATALGMALLHTESASWVKAVMVVTAALGAFALGLNLSLLLPRLRGDKILSAGGYFAHLGFTMMLIGVVASSGYSLHKRVDLAQGETKSAFGNKLTFEQISTDPANPNKSTMDIRVDSGDETFIAKPAMEANPRMGESEPMRKPHIRKSWFSDLYISPQAYQPKTDAGEFQAMKNQPPTEIGGYQIKFTGFEVPKHGGGNAPMTVGAKLEITKNGKTEKAVPMLEVGGPGGSKSLPVKISNGAAAISLNRMNVESQSVTLSLAGPGILPSPEIAVVEVSTKPLVNLVWLGTILMVLGGALASHRRARESQTASLPAPPTKARARKG